MKTHVRECDGLFEAMSAMIDGEASPEEVRSVQAHLSGCAHCREVEAALRGLGGADLVVPALPGDFAARTRRLVEERAARTWATRFEELARRFDALFPAARLVPVGAGPAESPLAALMQTRADRAGARGPSFWLALAAGIYGLPALLLGLVGWDASGVFFLSAVGLGLLAVLPVYHFRTDVSILTSLRRGRCLEEIVGTGMPSSRIVDALASFSLRSLLRVGWPVALVMLCGTPLFPSEDRPMAALAAVLWLPALALVFAVGSYAVQALVVFARAGDRPTLASAGALAVMAVPAAGLSTVGFAGALAAALWVAAAGRTLATWGLDHAPTVERWTRSAAPRRNRWVRAWSDNPIVVREVTRVSAAVPLGLLGLFLVRFVPALLPAAAAWGVADAAPEDWALAFWCGVAALGWLSYLRAAGRTSSAVAQETEGSTLETMVQSGMTRQEFLSGWIAAACAPLYLELLVTAALVAAVALTLPEAVSGWAEGVSGTLDLGAAILAVTCLAAMPLAGAWAGLAVSASSANRREAGGRTLGSVLRSVGLWLAVWGALTTALTAGSAVFTLSFDGDVWQSLVYCVLPTAALGLSLLGITTVSRRTASAQLAARWDGEPLPATEGVSSSRRLVRSLVLAPAALAALFGLAQAGLFLSLLMTLANSPAGPMAWLVASLVASGIVGYAGWTMVRPLTLAVVDHATRTVWGTALLAGFFGGLAGAAAGTVPLIARLASLAGFPMLGSLGLDGGVALGPSVTGGFLAAALVAALGWLARPPAPEPPRTFRQLLRDACGPSVGRSVAAAVTALAVGVGLVAFMVHQSLDTQLEEPALASLVLEQAAARESARLAVKPDQDGFALLRPVFMHRSQTAAVGVGRRVQETIDGFSGLSWAAAGDEPDIREMLAGDPRKAREGAAALDRTLPLLREALSRPEFVAPPRWSEGIGAWVPNFILMRRLSQSLWIRAMMHEDEGRIDEALETHLLNLRWSNRMAGQGNLIFGMIQVAMDSIAQEGLLQFLGRQRLSPQQYQRILEAEARGLSVDSFQANLDDEFAFGHRAFDEASSGSFYDDADFRVLLFVPRPYLERERRVYSNEFLRQRRLLTSASNRQLVLDQVDPRLLGSHPFSIAAMLTPNLKRAIGQVRLSLTRREAVRTVCLLELHRLRTGSYPDAAPASYSPLEEGPLHYERIGDGYRLWSESPVLKMVGTWSNQTREVWMPRE